MVRDPAYEVDEAAEEFVAKVLLQAWGWKWVEYADIPPLTDANNQALGEAYHRRIDAQDTARIIMSRWHLTPRVSREPAKMVKSE